MYLYLARTIYGYLLFYVNILARYRMGVNPSQDLENNKTSSFAPNSKCVKN
jgi:hypothetical protein